MSKHPSPESLLEYVDSEPAASHDVSAHLAACGECRAWLNEIETGVADYRNAWMPVLNETASAPPAPWFNLRARLVDLDRTPPQPERSFFFWPRWAAVIAAVLITIVGGYWFSEQPVSASELLRRAADRESAAQPPRPPIRISTRSGSLVRYAVWRQPAAPLMTAADRRRAESLQTLFESANYSWEDPLSARSFSAWRERLRDRQDRLVKQRLNDRSESYEISTRTTSGPLVEVKLALRSSDLHAVHGTWRFNGDQLVEITELPGAVLNPSAPPPVVPRPSQPPAHLQPAADPITPGDELRVRAALRGIDADLGEPIEVERDPRSNAIVVTALGLTPDRRRALENALTGVPRVQLRFLDPQTVREPSRRIPGNIAGQEPPLQGRLESQFGNRTLAEEFTNRILDASDSSLVRAHALRELAQQFPPEVQAQLHPRDHALLDSLLAQHFAALRESALKVSADARRIVESSTPTPELEAANWQIHTQRLVTATERVDQILSKLLAGSSAADSAQTLQLDLDRALVRMEAEISAAGPAFAGAR